MRVPPSSSMAYRSGSSSTSATTKTSSRTSGNWPNRCGKRCATRSVTTSAWKKANCLTEGPYPPPKGREKATPPDGEGKASGLDRERVPRSGKGERAALVDRGQRRDEIVEALHRVVASQRLVGRTQRRAARSANGRPIEGQLRVKVIEEEVAAAGRDLVRITRGVVVDVIPMALGPPILLSGIELLSDLWMAFEGQHAGERFAVGHGAVPAVVDGSLEDLDDFRGEKARCTNGIGQHMDVSAGAGHVVGAAGIRIRVDVKGQARWSQPAEPHLGRGVIRLGA